MQTVAFRTLRLVSCCRNTQEQVALSVPPTPCPGSLCGLFGCLVDLTIRARLGTQQGPRQSRAGPELYMQCQSSSC